MPSGSAPGGGSSPTYLAGRQSVFCVRYHSARRFESKANNGLNAPHLQGTIGLLVCHLGISLLPLEVGVVGNIKVPRLEDKSSVSVSYKHGLEGGLPSSERLVH